MIGPVYAVFASVCLTIHAFPEASINSEDANKDTETKCPGGFKEGVQVDMGRYWYECRSGELTPKGCFNDQRVRISIGDTYDSNKAYRMQCVKDSLGLAITYKSCIDDNGLERMPGDSWDDGKFWYTCIKDGDYLKMETSGCIDKGRRVPANSKVVRNSFVYQCKRNGNGTCSMCPVACEKNGHEYQIGETFPVDDFLYTCMNTERGAVSIKRIGCVNDQKEPLKDGDQFFKNDVVFECTVRQDNAEVRPVACVQKDENGAAIERKLDCYWNEGKQPYEYQMTCKQEKGTAVKVPVNCIYKADRGTYTVEPGCYQIADKTVISCEKEQGSAWLTLRTYEIDDIGQITAKGMRNC